MAKYIVHLKCAVKVSWQTVPRKWPGIGKCPLAQS